MSETAEGLENQNKHHKRKKKRKNISPLLADIVETGLTGLSDTGHVH